MSIQKWFDRQPLPCVVVAGAVLGLVLGLGCFGYLRAPIGLLLWGVLFVALWRVGHDAEPVFEDEQHIPAKPQRVRDGLLVMMEHPGGTFRMGSPDSDDIAPNNEKPQHTVTVSGFRSGVTPVTATLYREVMQKEPPSDEQRRLPIVGVSWEDAFRFRKALSEREGYQPCYHQVNGEWNCDWGADGPVQMANGIELGHQVLRGGGGFDEEFKHRNIKIGPDNSGLSLAGAGPRHGDRTKTAAMSAGPKAVVYPRCDGRPGQAAGW